MKFTLVVIGGKKTGLEIPISPPEYLIGRGEDCHLRPQNPLVSRKHCVISVGKVVFIEDCGSANGTFVNGEKLQQRHELRNSDRIKIGAMELEVHLAEDETAVYGVQGGLYHSHNGSGRGQHNVARDIKGRTASDKPSASNGAAKKQPTQVLPLQHKGQVKGNSHAPRDDIRSGEADFLGWLDSRSNGNGKKVALPVAKRMAKTPSPTAPLPNGEGSHTGTPRSQAGERNCIEGAIPLVVEEKSSEVALVGGKNYGWAAADLLAEIDGLHHDSLGQASNLPYDLAGRAGSSLDDSVWQVGNLSHGQCDLSEVLEGEDQSKKEWDGTDLLLLAAFGLSLVVFLSWLFPMSWPENGRGLSGWLRWCLQNWWHIWWVRWGWVAILMAVLLKLLCVRARSEQRG